MGGLKLDGLKQVRFSFADQHGVLRGKTLAVSEVQSALKTGVGYLAGYALHEWLGRLKHAQIGLLVALVLVTAAAWLLLRRRS